jgi:uncharacterized protein (TIGR02001 family)
MKGIRRSAGVLAAVLLIHAASGSAAEAQESWLSGNVAMANDYPFRGISQTLEKPVVQGGFELAGPLGLYAGLWGSSVNFGEELSDGARAQLELDPYVGVALELGIVEVDASVTYYSYPGAAASRGYDFVEFGVGVGGSLGPLVSGLAVAYSPNFFGGSGTGVYAGLGTGLGIPGTPFGLEASLGRQTIEGNDVFGVPDYTTWSAGLTADYLGTTFGAAYVGTNLSRADCFGGDGLCRGRLVVSAELGL